MPLEAVLFNDPCCPWGYSAWPALATLRWRYGKQLRWRLAMIGVSETPRRYERAGHTPSTLATRDAGFRDTFGMPFGAAPRPRVQASGLACRTVVAARELHPGSEWHILRALQFACFCSDVLIDTEAGLRVALDGLDADRVIDAACSGEIERAYQRDRALARQAAAGPAHAQGKTATDDDGTLRFTAPTLVLRNGTCELQAGGWQTLASYDVCVANLAPHFEREPSPASPLDALLAFGHGLTTQEIAQITADPSHQPNRPAAYAALLGLTEHGDATRTPMGSDALWHATVPAPAHSAPHRPESEHAALTR